MIDPKKHPALSQIQMSNVRIDDDIQLGQDLIHLIAGPCAVESAYQLERTAAYVSELGCGLLRGGAFKPRTNPHSFQGLGREGLRLMQQVAKKYRLKTVSECMDVRNLDLFFEYDIDIIQVGARNMQNFDLLRELGHSKKPVILKRGIAATISEWLDAAEYIAMGGNQQIIFCERGIRSYEKSYRNLFDVSAIALVKQETACPVIADPSHAAGRADLVPALAYAAIAAGADGLLIETHYNPAIALSDKEQALDQVMLQQAQQKVSQVSKAVGRALYQKHRQYHNTVSTPCPQVTS